MASKQRRVAATPTQGVQPEDAIRRLIDQIIADLSPFQVTVPDEWQSLARPETPYYGLCFQESRDFATNLYVKLDPNDPAGKEIWLVHGEYMGWERHAWVELPGGVVFDGVAQRFYERQGYYNTVYASPWYMYTVHAAYIIEARMPHFSNGTAQLADWHIPLQMPWADPKNPTRIDHNEAVRLLEARGLMESSPPRERKRKRGTRSH